MCAGDAGFVLLLLRDRKTPTAETPAVVTNNALFIQIKDHPCAGSGASTYHSRAPNTVAARRELQGLNRQDSKYDEDTATARAINPANQNIMVTPSMATMISRCARLGAYIGARIR